MEPKKLLLTASCGMRKFMNDRNRDKVEDIYFIFECSKIQLNNLQIQLFFSETRLNAV